MEAWSGMTHRTGGRTQASESNDGQFLRMIAHLAQQHLWAPRAEVVQPFVIVKLETVFPYSHSAPLQNFKCQMKPFLMFS